MKMKPYAIGSEHLPGLGKLIEEAGEVQQVAGKILGAGGLVQHWDGTDLRERMIEELADLAAAASFFAANNNLDLAAIQARTAAKLELFGKWHQERLAAGWSRDETVAALRAENEELKKTLAESAKTWVWQQSAHNAYHWFLSPPDSPGDVVGGVNYDGVYYEWCTNADDGSVSRSDVTGLNDVLVIAEKAMPELRPCDIVIRPDGEGKERG